MREDQKQPNQMKELEFEEILENLLKIKPPEKKKPCLPNHHDGEARVLGGDF